MIYQNPDELVTILLNIITSTDNDSIKNLSLILLGRFFTIVRDSKITLSETASEFIQKTLFSFFQKENFTKQNYDFFIIRYF